MTMPMDPWQVDVEAPEGEPEPEREIQFAPIAAVLLAGLIIVLFLMEHCRR